MANVLMIIAPKNFRDEELFHTKEEIEKEGNSVTIASKVKGKAVGMLGGNIEVETVLDDIDINNYDAIIFVGGTGSSIYFNDEKALEIAKEAYEKDKIVGAICIAPSILANAGILKGKRATSYPSEKTNLSEKGAYYTGESVTVDGRIVTASGPSAARDFGKAIAKLIS